MQATAPNPANLRGALFMTAAMAGFAVEDMFLKAAGRDLPVGMVLILFGTLGLAGFAAMTLQAGERLLHSAILSRPILIRAVFEVMGRLFYTLAIVFTDLSTASAILQAAPLAVMAGAALVFGERIGLLRWVAVLAGFLGVMIILRPGVDGFSTLSLFAVLGTIGFVGRDLATRAAPRVLSWRQLGVYGFAMLIPAGLILLAITGGARLPNLTESGLLLAASIVGVAGYTALTIAMQTGDVGAVTPFRYTRLVFALILGVLVFREQPEGLMLVGSAVVVGSGLVALLVRR